MQSILSAVMTATFLAPTAVPSSVTGSHGTEPSVANRLAYRDAEEAPPRETVVHCLFESKQPARTRDQEQIPTPADDARALVKSRVEAIEASLDKVQANKAYNSLFTSDNAVLLMVQASFARAQKSAHDVIAGLEKGVPVDTGSVDMFHSWLREFLLNVQEIPPEHMFGETKSPDVKSLRKLVEEVKAVIEAANKIKGFEEVSVAGLPSNATPLEAAAYARRNLTEVYVLLNNRTLTNVTSNGIEASASLRGALEQVTKAIDALVDMEGKFITQMAEDGEVLTDQLAPFKKAMKEVGKQAEFYRKTYQPNAWREAHRRRAEMIEKKLAQDGFHKAFLGAMKVAIPGSNKSKAALRR